MKVNRKKVAQKITDYLYHRITLKELVDWAETIMMEADFEEKHFDIIKDIIARIGVADVKAFGLTWEKCEYFLSRLGYRITINITEEPIAA